MNPFRVGSAKNNVPDTGVALVKIKTEITK